MRRRFADEIAQALDALLFASPSHRGKRRLADELAQLTRVQQDLVLHWTQVVAQTNPELAWQLCARAARALARPEGVCAEDLVAWMHAVLAEQDAAALDGAAPAQPALNDFDGFLARRAQHAPAYAELSARLALFVCALSAGELRLGLGDGGAWTDGASVFLPERLPAGQTSAHYRALAALACLQWQSGSLGEDIEGTLNAADPGAAAWYAVLEARRLRALLRRRFPGLAAVAPAVAELPVTADELATLESDPTPRHSLTLAQALAVRGLVAPAGGLRVDFAAVRARRQQLTDELPARRRANSFHSISDGATPAQPRGQALNLALPADNGANAGSAGADEASSANHEHTVSPPPPEATPGMLRPAGAGRWRPAGAQSDQRDADNTAPAVAPDARYDEWDYRRQSYRRGWCLSYEVAPPSGDAEWVTAVLQRHRPAVAAIRRRFESLRAAPSWQRRQLDGDEIDLDALVAAHAERRAAGVAGEIDTRLFRRHEIRQRSLAVALLVDMSGSTKGWVNEAEREALALLCEALDSLGDRYAIYGFSGWTHRRCDIYPIKEFAERYGDAVKARIVGIEARDYTRMGPAIRHAMSRLKQQPERHKLLVCISDGRPDDFGDEYRGRYGIEDTRRALHEARLAGVRNYCITVDRHAADYLPQLYGRAHYTVLADAGALPLRIAQVYRRLVR